MPTSVFLSVCFPVGPYFFVSVLSQSEVREKTAKTLGTLTLNEAGKQFAIKAGAIQHLCKLLDDANYKVRANCASALMNIAIDDMGKQLVIEAGGTERLIELLHDTERLVILNAVKAIAAVCPHPKAREIFVGSDDCIQTLTALVADTSDELLCRSARIAKEVVEWMP